MKSIAEAAKAAVNGEDDVLWQACMERINARGEEYAMCATDMLPLIEHEIREMLPAERALYDISEE